MNYLALHPDLGNLYHQDILIYLKSQEALEIHPAQECQRFLGSLKRREEIISTARKMHNCNYKDSPLTTYKNGNFKVETPAVPTDSAPPTPPDDMMWRFFLKTKQNKAHKS